MKIAIIDNYDSFTFNLSHIIKSFGVQVDTLRNDRFRLDDLAVYDKIVLSPGPGIPSEAGLLTEVIEAYAPCKPMLGVCLGHQAIAEVFGGRLENLAQVFHGVASEIKITGSDYIFDGLGETFEAGRYHSWAVAEPLPACLEATAFSPEGQIMALRHRTLDVHGIQFHPESVLTPKGRTILENFVKH